MILIAAFISPVAYNSLGHAQDNKQRSQQFLERHPKSGCYRRDGEHRCASRNGVGGYSYEYQDGIILDTEAKKQTGPFDSGFFFDTTSNESTYLNN